MSLRHSYPQTNDSGATQSDEWYAVTAALDELYESYYENGSDHETTCEKLRVLMEAYDEWLD